MQNLWQFLVRYFHWLLFLLLEVASLFLLFSYNSYQGSVWVSSANAAVGTIYSWQSSVEQFFSLRDVNDQLTQRNIYLERQLSQLRSQLRDYSDHSQASVSVGSDLSELSVLSDSSESPKFSTLIPAKVVSNTVNRPDNLITIDRGLADGVRPDMGVACGTGLVGVVYLASEHYAVVLPVLNNRSRISCSIRGRDFFGYLTWTGGDPSRAYVEDIPRHAKFRKGDWVETSGYSSIFPPGVAVGRIEKIYNSHDGLSYRLLVHLSTDFARLRDVCVFHDDSFAERRRLREAALDSLARTP